MRLRRLADWGRLRRLHGIEETAEGPKSEIAEGGIGAAEGRGWTGSGVTR